MMADPSPNLPQLRMVQTLCCAAGIVVGGILLGLGISGASSTAYLVAAGGALLLFLAVLAITLLPTLRKIESTTTRQLGELRDLHDLFAKQLSRLEEIAANTLISDAAKSLANREQELQALRTVIREDIRNERWEAALNLINEMERRFGYKEEAERSREELDDARNAQIQTKLNQAIEIIESHLRAFEWDRAAHEIDRLMHALPNDPRVINLEARLRQAREQRKQDLLKQWNDAVKNEDIDHAIELLKELDLYLSRSEAQALEDSARQVFKQRLLQLGVQFRFAVNEKRWQDAQNIGLDIVREFPNTRMATEVRELMDTLRERARHAVEQEQTSTRAAR